MNWQTFLVIFLLLISALISFGLAVFAGRRRDVAGSQAFALLTGALGVWSLFYACEIYAPTLSGILLWSKLQYIGIATIPVGWFLFAMIFSGRTVWWSRGRIAALAVIPLMTVLAAFSNEAHGLFWTTTALNTSGPFITLDASYGILWQIFFAYSYILLFIGSVVLFLALWNFPAAYRWQLIILLSSPLLPWLGNVLYILRLSPVPQLDLAPFAFTISTVILSVGIFRFHLLDIVPMARSVVVDNINIAMFVIDRHNRIIDVNPAARRMLGVKDDRWIGQSIEQALARWSETVAEYVDTLELEKEISLPVGEQKRYFNLRISPIYNHAQQLTGRLVMLNDITAIRLAEEAVAMAQVRTEFMAKVGHELRTPLNGILGLIEMIEYGVYGPVTEQQGEVLQTVVERTKYLTRLVNDLLQLVRFEGGQFNLVVEAFQIADLLEKVQETFGAAATQKGIELSCEVAAEVPATLYSDPTRIYQILANLVENAVKFTDTGRVNVRAYRLDEERWALEVADTGIGIPQHMQEHVFGAFTQANYSITRERDGVGLGLSIVKQLAVLMGGDVTVTSEDGKGSVFTVILPVKLPEKEQNE